MAVVYRHIKKDNLQPFYIGIGKEEKRAYNFHKNKRSKFWNRVYNKYGCIVEILAEDISWEDACELEMFLISEYGRIDNKTGVLVNMTDGGEGFTGSHSDESKKKMSISGKGKNIGHSNGKGYKHTDEAKIKISEASKGNDYAKCRKGYKHKEESKLKTSNSLKGRVFSDETKRKMSESAKLYWLNKKNNTN